MTKNEVLGVIVRAIFNANKTHDQFSRAPGEEPIYVSQEMGGVYARAALDALIECGVIETDD